MFGNGRRYDELNERITDVHVMLDSMRDMLMDMQGKVKNSAVVVEGLKEEVHGGVNGIADKCDAVLRMMTEISTKLEVMKLNLPKWMEVVSGKCDTVEGKVDRLGELVAAGIEKRGLDFSELKEGLGRIVAMQERGLGMLDCVIYGQAAMLRGLKAVMEHHGVDTSCLFDDNGEPVLVPVCVDAESKAGVCDAEVTGATAEVDEPAVDDKEDNTMNAVKPDCDGCVHEGDSVEEPCDVCRPERNGRKRHGRRR